MSGKKAIIYQNQKITYLALLFEVEPLLLGVVSVFFSFGFDWAAAVEVVFIYRNAVYE